MTVLSVVCPVFGEEKSLPEFYRRTTKALEQIEPPVDHELVFVDDGSQDDSFAILRELAGEDPRVRVIALSRNFGHQLAVTAGIDNAHGDAVVLIDTDLQDPPEVIAAMVERWRAGFRVVYGVRTRREGESRFKLITAKAFYRLLNRLSDVELPLDSGDFRLMDRKVVDALGQVREENRYIRGLVAWVGFSQCAVEYTRDSRFAGESKYSMRRMIRFALDGITSFSERPLRLAAQVGALTTLASLILAMWIVVSKLVEPDRSLPGFASITTIVLFMGGVQLLSLGLMGEYIGRIYRESKRRPLYIVAETVNAGPDNDDDDGGGDRP